MTSASARAVGLPDQVSRLGFPDELCPELGMGDVDQRLGPLLEVSSPEIRDSIFRDDLAHIPPRRHDTGAFLEGGDDPGYLAVFGRRGQGEGRLPPLGV